MSQVNDNRLNWCLKSLFSKYEFVISWHFWFNWFPEWISSTSEYISIKQKLKLKCYLWIKKIEQKWIFFQNIKMSDWGEIIDYDLGKFNQQYKCAIDYLVTELSLTELKYWYEISILSEVIKWEWLGFTWVMMALIVSWIYYLEGKISNEILNNYIVFQHSELFNKINNIAHHATLLAKNWNVWSASFTALVKGSHPYAYITENEEEITGRKYWLETIDLFNIQNFPMPTLPFCWAIVYTWQKSDTSFAVGQKEFVENNNLECQKWFNKLELWKVDSKLKKWLEKLNYYETKITNLNNMSINILYLIEQIYKKWAKNQYIYELIRLMNFINTSYNDVEQDFDVTNDFQISCIKNWVSLSTFWFSPIYTNKYGWDYLVIFEDDSDLSVLETVLEDMKNNYPDIRIRETYDFDTPAEDWIIIEQDIKNNIWKISDDDLYILINNEHEQKFISYTDIEPTEQKWILLDWVKNKIYINWKILTSKDIKSATTTIELFEYLLKDENHQIRNNELWPSSFSEQLNQMESKIIYPFIKAIKKYLWKDFPIECTWSLREFYISLWKTDINIQLLKKY